MARQRKKDLEASASPPAVPPVNPDGVPALLRDCDQWVLWKYERRTDNRGGARWTKVPIKVSSRVMASATDPETWCGFDDALAVYRRTRDVHAGVGFVFHADDPFCGIDLDDCRDPASGEIAQWAADIILAINSYTEVSPSGTGVKIIIQGFVPGGRNRVKYEGGEFECYDCARFFVITGNVVDRAAFPNLSTDINDAQAAFESIYARVFANVEHEPVPAAASGGAPPSITNVTDSQLLDRIFSSAVGDGFRRLWYGDTSQCEGDSSRADFQLCRFLAWWCHGDEGRVDGLFRQSGLMRPKWNESRGGGTYGEKTIRFAVGTLRTFYDPAACGNRTQASGTSGAGANAVDTSANPGAVSGSDASQTPQPPDATTPPPAAGAPGAPGTPGAPGYRLANYILLPTITADGRQLFAPRGLSAPEIATAMRAATNNWPRRVGDQLFVPHPERRVHWIDDANSLFSWASGRLATAGGLGNPIQWAGRGDDMLTKSEYFRYLIATSTAYDGVEPYPHEPPIPNVYYCENPEAGGDGSALQQFLSFFSPATDLDRELLLSVLLTGAWGGEPGQRPMFAFVSEDGDPQRGRGAGKTTMAQQLASLWGQFYQIDPDDDVSDVQKRLLDPGTRHRFAMIDNVKKSRLSAPQIESLVTTRWISGRQMYVGEGGRPNYLTWLMTYNGVQLSSDFAQRSVLIHLARPKVFGRWVVMVSRFVEANRLAILGDLSAILRSPCPSVVGTTRWACWQEEVLSRVPHFEECRRLIVQRQAGADDDVETMELVREAFVTVLRNAGYEPDRTCVFITARQATDVLGMVVHNYRSVSKAVPYLAQVGVPELTRHRFKDARGFCWRGVDVDKDAAPKRFEGAGCVESNPSYDFDE